MAHLGAVLMLLVLAAGVAFSGYLFVGPLFVGRYRKPVERRREHRHIH